MFREEKLMGILKELYFGNYEPSSNFIHTPEYRAAVKTSTEYRDKVRNALSREFADELWNAQMDVTILECQHYYQEGFRLGFQMALAGMSGN